MKRIISVIITAVMLAVSLCSCDETGTEITGPQDFPVNIAGVEIKSAPQRVVCLSPSITEIIYSLGSYAQLCGVSDDCDYPAETEQKEKMGTASKPESEKILNANPDLVIASGTLSQSLTNALRQRGVPVLIIEAASSIDQLKEVYVSVASAFAGSETGRVNGENTYNRIIDKIKTLGTGEGKKAVFIPAKGIIAFKGSFISDIMELSGAENIAAGPIPEGSDWAAYIASLNPDYIFCLQGIEQSVAASLSGTNAAKNGNVKGVSPALYERQGGRIYEAAFEMHSAMYPSSQVSSDTAERGVSAAQ